MCRFLISSRRFLLPISSRQKIYESISIADFFREIPRGRGHDQQGGNNEATLVVVGELNTLT